MLSAIRSLVQRYGKVLKHQKVKKVRMNVGQQKATSRTLLSSLRDRRGHFMPSGQNVVRVLRGCHRLLNKF
jgi:hypothetical protein